jgi:hypothetical protein
MKHYLFQETFTGIKRPNHGVAKHREREKYRKKQSMRDIKKEVLKKKKKYRTRERKTELETVRQRKRDGTKV